MGEREKMAQIIAEHLCPQGRAHKTLYGAERMCYSRNNFADCEKVSECVDALIEAGFGDVSWWERKCKLCEEDWFLQKKQIEHYAESYKEMLQEDLDKYKHRSEVAEKERDEWKERAEKAENTLKEWVKCISPLQSAGFTINPLDVLRDSTKCITIAQRALENIIKQYWCDNRGCSECEEKQGCIEEICSRYIQQAEREIEEGKI